MAPHSNNVFTVKEDHNDGSDMDRELSESARSHFETLADARVRKDGEQSNVSESFFRRWSRHVSTLFVIILIAFMISAGASVNIGPVVVTVGSSSMSPAIQSGDLIVLAPNVLQSKTNAPAIRTHMESQRENRTQFSGHGSVVVFRPPGRDIAIIHRVRLRVERGDNWVKRADETFLSGATCARLATCPASKVGYITKGDANGEYDQVAGIAPVVAPDSIQGVAVYRPSTITLHGFEAKYNESPHLTRGTSYHHSNLFSSGEPPDWRHQ